MAEQASTHVQLFINELPVPNINHTINVQHIIDKVEAEYEFQHDIQN